jgi:ABC-type uncharacterized transport system auxiliary subunit
MTKLGVMFVTAMIGALGAACSSVDVPEDRLYGLVPGAIAAGDPLVGVLRVDDLQAMGALGEDMILVTDGLRHAGRPGERWVAPADRLVSDALVLGLARSGVARLVLGNADHGREEWRLHGRLIEFTEVRGQGGSTARVAIELWLVAGDVLLLRREFAVAVPIAGDTVAAVVTALSAGLDRVVGELVAALRAVDLPNPGAGAP